MSEKSTVLFICQQNSGRSQIAEALLRWLYGDRYEAYSAGVIASEINPYAIRVMEQLGVDMSGQRSKSIDAFRDMTFDTVVTVCDQAQANCPCFPGRHILHQCFASAPSTGSEAEIMAGFVRVRDEIRAWLETQFGP